MQVTRERIEAIPYSTLGVRVGPASWALMVLTTINDQELEWISSDGVKFVTVEGTIVRTRGMPRDLSSTLWSGGQAPPQFADPSAVAHGKQHSRSLSFQPDLEGWVPVVSQIYDGVRGVLKCLEQPSGESTPKRVVLVQFPHPGMRLPAIVTSSCSDIATGRKLLCVYVPTTPIPTSGFFLMVPEEEVMELNWDVQQTLQAIISGGLTAPPKVTYYSDKGAVPVLPEAPQPSSQPVLPGGSGKT